MTNVFKESPPLPPEDQRLVELYSRLGRPSDDLPYSADLQELMAALRAAGDTRSEREVVARLMRLRKAGRLPRATRPSTPIGDVTTDDVELLGDLLRRQLGALGSRDRLPYSDEFELLRQQYNERASRPLDPHRFWRLVARVSK